MTTHAKYEADMAKYYEMTYRYIYNYGGLVFNIDIKRIEFTGVWNGYVTLPKDCKEPEDINNLNVHGGITYTGEDSAGNIVIGFDTAHLGDYSPYIYLIDQDGKNIYRSHEYVLSECERLCRQLV